MKLPPTNLMDFVTKYKTILSLHEITYLFFQNIKKVNRLLLNSLSSSVVLLVSINFFLANFILHRNA